MVLTWSRLLLAVRDGLQARGPGGTGEIVGEVLARGLPVPWVQARKPHPIRIWLPGESSGPADEPGERNWRKVLAAVYARGNPIPGRGQDT